MTKLNSFLGSIFSPFWIILLFAGISACNGKTTVYSGPFVSVEKFEASLTVNTRGEVVLNSSYDVFQLGFKNLGAVGWTVGVERVLVQAESAKNNLFLIWQNKDGDMMQTVYDMGKPFDIQFESDQWVRKVSHHGDGNVIVSVEIRDTQVVDVPVEISYTEVEVQPVPTATKVADYPEAATTNKCPGAPQKRLSVGDSAIVCTKNETVYLRTEPRANADYTHRLVPGAELEVIGKAVCDKSKSWWYWKVRTESGYTGWVSEGGDTKDIYFLCPKD